ncbi:hypothetical protein F4778DRAFT_778879 [Xylariomycetidae sp. FL2044]|nr:hypothetical protein F4778DRAFT_778879 [Xylariomycetidae sp. FL2044]
MPAVQPSSGGFQIPKVSQAEIQSFHEVHFSSAAIDLFDAEFLQPHNAPRYDDADYDDYDGYYDVEEEEYDDGLGYYSDGVKRTLTDEQIAIFRHSELEALKRVEEKASKLKDESARLLQEAKDQDATGFDLGSIVTASEQLAEGDTAPTIKMEDMDSGSEDGEIETEKPKLTKAEMRRQKRQRARAKKRETRKFNPEPKPDLRKRTWDVVDAGMDSLYYDDTEAGQETSANQPTQRRQISYDD